MPFIDTVVGKCTNFIKTKIAWYGGMGVKTHKLF